MDNIEAIVRISSACLTPLIAVLAVYIAWQQHNTARVKLKLDLYERRFRVYRGLMNLLGAVANNGAVTQDDLAKFYQETDEKRFLFDSELNDYLKLVREKAVDLRALNRKIEGLSPDRENERSAAIDAAVDLQSWFDEQIEEASRRFDRYLNFKWNL